MTYEPCSNKSWVDFICANKDFAFEVFCFEVALVSQMKKFFDGDAGKSRKILEAYPFGRSRRIEVFSGIFFLDQPYPFRGFYAFKSVSLNSGFDCFS